jgi:hypothetical protein
LQTNNGSTHLLPSPWAFNCSKCLLPSPGYFDFKKKLLLFIYLLLITFNFFPFCFLSILIFSEFFLLLK